MLPLVADTCLALWLVSGAPLAASGASALADAAAKGVPVPISPISAWEVGLLVSRNRLNLGLTPESWFGRLLALPGLQLTAVTPRILIASSFLPGTPPRDPADRIIVATARDLGATLMTRDRLLLDYARQGHLRAVAC